MKPRQLLLKCMYQDRKGVVVYMLDVYMLDKGVVVYMLDKGVVVYMLDKGVVVYM